MGRSRATKPTLAQKKLISAAGLVANNWLVILDSKEALHLVHRSSGTARHIKKNPSPASKRG